MRSTLPLLPLCAAAALLFVAPLHAQSPVLLELQNAASIDRLVVDSAGGMVVRGTFSRGAIPASGGGARLMWYPRKAAFRAGDVEGAQWDDANIGEYSTAMGYNTTAIGNFSTAMGFGTTASGAVSTAMGLNTTASANYATAIGEGAIASNFASTSIGYFTKANGFATIAMGSSTTASGASSTAMGHNTTASGNASTALGYRASTNNHEGAFVYGDYSTGTVMNATANNQFSVRAAGGVRFFSNSGLTAGVTLAAGGGTWNAVSDRARKEHFLAVDGEDVLARIRSLPITTWRYIAEEDRTVRHIGPMAQDWHRAFGFSADSLHINSGDLDGVSLAGVQALEARAREQADRIRALEAENATLRSQLERIEQMLTTRAPRP